jgi:hypothetical protein
LFVTMPQFEQKGMSELAGGGQKYWRAITGKFPTQPWYLFVYEAQVLDTRINLTSLVAWEETLIEIINLVPTADHRALYRVEPAACGSLALRPVHSVWSPTEAEGAQGMPAVLLVEGHASLVDPFLHPVPDNSERTLVFRAPKSACDRGQLAE